MPIPVGIAIGAKIVGGAAGRVLGKQAVKKIASKAKDLVDFKKLANAASKTKPKTVTAKTKPKTVTAKPKGKTTTAKSKGRFEQIKKTIDRTTKPKTTDKPKAKPKIDGRTKEAKEAKRKADAAVVAKQVADAKKAKKLKAAKVIGGVGTAATVGSYPYTKQGKVDNKTSTTKQTGLEAVKTKTPTSTIRDTDVTVTAKKDSGFKPELKKQQQLVSKYQIKKGDTLSAIAKKNKTTIKKLQELNPSIKDPNKIIAGKTLKITKGESKNPYAMTSKKAGGKMTKGRGMGVALRGGGKVSRR